MKIAKILSSMLIVCVFLFTIFGNSFIARAATSVSINLEYAYEDIPQTVETSGWNHVYHGEVVYKVRVKATVYGGGYDIIGEYLNFNNPNTSEVKYIDCTSVDPYGVAYAYYEVRGETTFSCTASIDNGQFIGSASANITPEEDCWYEADFYITCYWTALEDDYSGSYDTVMPGLTGLYKQDFKDAVSMEGSGYSHYNQYVRYNTSTGNFEVGNPVTASGTTPTANKTIAVDNYYIPRYFNGSDWLRGTVEIYGGVGKRIAEDAGGAINQWDIDVYTGLGIDSAINKSYDCTYQWVYYYGNNKW